MVTDSTPAIDVLLIFILETKKAGIKIQSLLTARRFFAYNMRQNIMIQVLT